MSEPSRHCSLPVEDRILVIDDDPATLLAVAALINAKISHVVVDTAMSREGGLASVQTRNYGLVLLDILMPGVQGLDFFCELRKMVQELPIIVVTGLCNETLEKEALSLGAFAFLTKPVNAALLVQVIATALSRDGFG